MAWKKIDDNKVEATPALLNPDDQVIISVFLTDPTAHGEQPTLANNVPALELDARISNLKSFTEVPLSGASKLRFQTGWILVEMAGWGVPYFFVTFVMLQTLYLLLLDSAGLLQVGQIRLFTTIICVSLLSVTAAEASTTYVFGSVYTDLHGINHWLNAPSIALSALAIILLFILKKRKAS